MSNQPQTPPVSPTIQLILWILAAVGVPSAALTWANDQLPNNPWTLLSLAVAWVVLVVAARIVTQIWQGQEGRFVKSVEKRLNRANPFYRRRYLRHVVGRNRNFDVKGLTTQSTYNLELRRVFVDLSIAPRSSAFSSADPIRQMPPELHGQHSIWEYLRNPQLQHLAIVGPPGSGKTTLLKFMALALALPRFKHKQAAAIKKLSILLYLHNHSGAIGKDEPYSLVDAVEKSLAPYGDVTPPNGWFAAQLRDGKCLILLDGLDEVADEELRKKVSAWVEQQMIAYSDNRFLVTSRPHGYQSAPLSGVTVLEVQPFSQKQVERFVHNWYLANEVMASQKDDRDVEIDAKEGAEDLLQRLRNTPTLSELAVNPLLLTMIANVHRYRASLPGERVGLYSEVCEVFLGKRRQSIGISDDLSPAQKQRVLQPLAFHMMKQNTREIKLEDAEPVVAGPLALVYAESDKLNAKDFFKLIEAGSGLLLEREAGEYSFAHLAFQEYLAAVHALEEQQEGVLLSNLDQSWWHETILLYVAQTDASNVIKGCLALHPPSVNALLLALDCIDEAREVQPELREQLSELLLEDAKSPDRARLVGEVLLTHRLHNMIRVNKDLYIDTTYVRHVEYQLFLNEKRLQNEYFQPDHWRAYRFPNSEGAKPVVGVRPSDAQAFCDWLNQRSDFEEWVIRLPQPGELENFNLPNDTNTQPGLGYWVTSGLSIEFEVFSTQQLPLSVHWLESQLYFDTFTLLSYMIFHTHRRALFHDHDQNFAFDLACARALAYALDRILNRNYNFDLTRDRVLVLGSARTLTHTLDRALDRILDRDQARTLAFYSARDLTLERDLNSARELVSNLALKRNLNFDYTRVLDLDSVRIPVSDLELDLSRVRDFDFDLNLNRAFNLDCVRDLDFGRDLDRGLDLALKRGQGRGAESVRMDLRLHIRLVTLYLASVWQAVIDSQKLTFAFSRHRNKQAAALLELRDTYLQLYKDIAILEGRIRGELSAFEGIRLIRERIDSKEIN